MIHYPEKLNTIFKKLKNYGIKPIIVGGYIRDFLLNIESKDIDIEIYGISSFNELENILKEFGNINIVGKSFGVCKLYYQDYDLDFSFPRKDNKIKPGHRGFDIKIESNIDFKTATSRRDFTINSIGFDVIEKKILDPFNGINDLKNKILKAVDLNSFSEDPLRVLRAVQFSTRFDLQIDKNLYNRCKKMVSKKMLDELPKERIFEEIKKLLLFSKKPSIGFKLLKELGSDIYTNNLSVIDEIAKQMTTNKQTNLVLMLSGLCYNFTQTEAENFIFKLTNEKKILNRVTTLINKHKKIDTIYEDGINNYMLYKLATEVNINELLILSSSIYFSYNNSKIYKAGEEIYKRAKKLNILNNKLPPILMGKDILELGLKPSPLFSEILHLAYEAQMNGKFNNYIDAKKWLKNYLKFSKKN